MAQCLLVGSTEPYSGKSAAILGLASHLQHLGLPIAYGKPLGSLQDSESIDPDIRFIARSLGLSESDQPPTLLQLNQQVLLNHLQHPHEHNYLQALQTYIEESRAELILLEGPATLAEGKLFGLSLAEMSRQLQAQVLLIARYHSALVVETLLNAYQQLRPHLAGVIINDVPEDQLTEVETVIRPYLESQGIPILGVLVSNPTLRSISVEELAHHLQAEVLCCPDRLDVMVEDFVIGAMNVNSALRYFRKAEHKAVITGGDRTDIQLAALETSTYCLILTGKLPLDSRIRRRAEDLEVPVLSVDLDTFATIARIEQLFGQVRLHEAAKVRAIQELMSRNFDFNRLAQHLHLTQPLASSKG